MRMTWLPFVVEIITSLLVSVCSRNVTLCFLKQISWSTRIFLINDEVEWVIMGGFNKCRWSESKKSDITLIKWCLYLKESFIFFLQNILFFFDLWWNMNTTFFERHPTGPEVLAQLFQMFWHTERESFWKLALDCHILSFFYYNILLVLWLLFLSKVLVESYCTTWLLYIIILFQI